MSLYRGHERQPTPPREILKSELMDAWGLDNAALAKAIGVEEGIITSLLDGERKIDLDLAIRLGIFFHMSATFWLNLQHNYEGWCLWNGEQRQGYEQIVPADVGECKSA